MKDKKFFFEQSTFYLCLKAFSQKIFVQLMLGKQFGQNFVRCTMQRNTAKSWVSHIGDGHISK